MDQEPEVISCYFDAGFEPALAAMRIAWPDESARPWKLPRQVHLHGGPPRQFGLRLQRVSLHRYAACLVWDDYCLRWSDLDADELRQSDLPQVLKALHGSLDYLLEQPVDASPCPYAAVG